MIGPWRRRGLPAAGLLAGLLAFLVLPSALVPASASAQGSVEEVLYRNPDDGTPLGATLHLPPGDGPFPAMVVLTLAGTRELVDRMEGLGWAVMVPERRGTAGAPELLLEATFRDLAVDAGAALVQLRARPEIDGGAVGLLAQGGETVVGAMAAAEPPVPAFVVLMAARGISGDEIFRLQQRASAEIRGLDAEEAEALDRQAERLVEIVRAPDRSSLTGYRIRALLRGASVRPQQSSSLPPELEGQVEFFSSTWWRDYFTVEPDTVLARMGAPMLVLQGTRPVIPMERNFPPLRRSLAAAPAEDVTLCVVEGRVEHAFPATALDALEGWLRVRAPADGAAGVEARPGVAPPKACLEDPDAG